MDVAQPVEILVIRYSALGDVVLATSVLEPLHDRYPGARVEWVTSARYAGLLEGLPAISRVHALRPGVAATRALSSQLRRRFDLVLDLQHKLRSIALARRSAPVRVVFRRRTWTQALLSLARTEKPLVRAHATQLYSEALAPLGIVSQGQPQVSLSARAEEQAAHALRNASGTVVAIAPGTRWETKRWPVERFVAVADALASDGVRIVLCGGPGDDDALNAFRLGLRAGLAADLSALPADGLAAAISRVQLLISCDSGPMHLATAVGTPVLALFGPTSTTRWGPPAPGRALSLGLPCAPCSNHGSHRCPLGHHRCLQDLPVGLVLSTARAMLQARSPSRATVDRTGFRGTCGSGAPAGIHSAG